MKIPYSFEWVGIKTTQDNGLPEEKPQRFTNILINQIDRYCCNYMEQKLKDDYHMYFNDKDNRLENQCEECESIPFKYCPNCGEKFENSITRS